MSGYIKLHDDEPTGAAHIAMLELEANARRINQQKTILKLEKELVDERVRVAKLAAMGYYNQEPESAEFPTMQASDFG
jgi:hypothetical protein